MLNIAKINANKEGINNIEFKHGNFLNLCIRKHSIDMIVSSLALHHLPNKDKEKFIKLMARTLKENGRVLIGDIMFFFHPKKEFRKLNFIKKFIEELFPKSDFDLVSGLDSEYPSLAEDLKTFFKKNGFSVKIESLLPILGIIYAVRKK